MKEYIRLSRILSELAALKPKTKAGERALDEAYAEVYALYKTALAKVDLSEETAEIAEIRRIAGLR